MLLNLGTPDNPSTKAVRRYLAEFLWDPRVIELPRWLWWLVLNFVVLTIRPRRSAALYRRVWSPDGSPLLVHSQRQRAALHSALETHFHDGVHVALGMRYGNPSIASALHELAAFGAERVFVLPAYPQYSGATVGSAFDAVATALGQVRCLPELRFLSGYHLDKGYINALVESIRLERIECEQPDRKLLFSFHGLPKRYVDNGDPYRRQCEETARAVAHGLGLEDDSWALAFQSRVGREEWLKPYTHELLAKWAADAVSSVDVICPGFSADCLETVDEIEREAREVFVRHGGKNFRYIPALNANPTHIGALANLVLTRTADWRTPAQNAPESPCFGGR